MNFQDYTFVTLMPYSVTLASKLGFGLAMGWIFVTPAKKVELLLAS